MMAFWTIYP